MQKKQARRTVKYHIQEKPQTIPKDYTNPCKEQLSPKGVSQQKLEHLLYPQYYLFLYLGYCF